MNFTQFKQKITVRQQELRAKGLSASITPAQFKMLKHLWDAGNSFPRDWVPRDELHDLINQSDYRRRITELKDERGIDIELNKSTNQYRLKSDQLQKATPRNYLNSKQKNSLLQSQDFTCQTCGSHDNGNENKTLQADHKIPLSRGGHHNTDNWQTLCYICNVGKRRACEGCSRDCQSCIWAFPEKAGIITLVKLPHELHRKIKAIAGNDADDINTVIVQELNKSI